MDDLATGDFQDWELLHNSDSDSVQETNDSEDIEDESEGIIKRDYFSLDSEHKYRRIIGNDEEGSVDSDNPSWIDPDSVTQSPRRDLAGFWSDYGSDGSEERKLEMGFAENGKNQVGFEVRELGFDEIEEKVDDCCGNGGFEEKNEEGIGENDEKLEEKMCNDDEEGEKRRMMIWWKLPLEILKYCVIRINPVWSVSVAAAVMGFFILGRRYYRMKKKSRSLELNVTMDDKKVSQFMSKVAKLNEAFSVVKRVPIIRPSLPATGVTPWPIMALIN